MNELIGEFRANGQKEDNQQQSLTAEQLALLTDDDLRRMARDSLVMMIHANRGDLKALGAIRELLDRLEGKPVQRIATKDVTNVDTDKAEYSHDPDIAAFLAIEYKPIP